MVGANELCLNEATMIRALQHYFDTVMFAKDQSPSIQAISLPRDPGKTFTIKCVEKPIPKVA